MSIYLVGVFGALIGGYFARYFAVPEPYYYLLIIGSSVVFYLVAEKYNKK